MGACDQHCGARSTANLPINRGFDHHLGFLKGVSASVLVRQFFVRLHSPDSSRASYLSCRGKITGSKITVLVAQMRPPSTSGSITARLMV